MKKLYPVNEDEGKAQTITLTSDSGRGGIGKGL